MTPYYEHAGITIYHGDCREVLPMLPQTIRAIVTSPPYNTLGSRVPSNPSGMHATNKWISKVREKGYADDMDETQYIAWQRDVAAAVYAVTEPGGSFFYNHKLRYRHKEPIHPIDIVRTFTGWSVRQEVIWDRCCAFAFNARMFAPSDERIYWMVKDGADHQWCQDAASFLTVWRIPPVVGDEGHPCPYPEDIPIRCLMAATVPSDTVLDPFMGSGTTLVAAKRLGRKAIGIEREEKYCEIAAKRLQQEALPLECA